MKNFAVNALFFLIRIIPYPLLPYFSSLILRLTMPARKKDLARIKHNVARVYGLPQHSSFAQTFGEQVFRHQIIGAMEVLRGSQDLDRLQFTGYEDLAATVRQLTAAGKGLVIATGHMGSWELVGHVVAKANGGNFHALAKPSRSAALNHILEKMRNRFGIQVLWTHKGILKSMIKVIRDAGILGFVMDQKPEDRRGPLVDFMGFPTEFINGPGAIVTSTQCPALAVFCMRTGPWHYRIIYKVVLEPNHGCEDATEATQLMAKEIERVIRLYPEQWAWNYKRWRFVDEPA